MDLIRKPRNVEERVMLISLGFNEDDYTDWKRKHHSLKIHCKETDKECAISFEGLLTLAKNAGMKNLKEHYINGGSKRGGEELRGRYRPVDHTCGRA